RQAAAETGLAEGTPVIAGATDFPAEVVSTGVASEGDLIVSYGTTMVLVAFAKRPISCPGMFAGPCLAGGLSNLYAGLFSVGGGRLVCAWIGSWPLAGGHATGSGRKSSAT